MDGTGYGDHYVNIKIAVPGKLNDKTVSIAPTYAELEEDTPGSIHGITYKTDGSKQSYTGPLHLVESIRIALGDKNVPNSQCSTSEPQGPGDQPLNKTRIKNTRRSDEDDDAPRRREVS